METKTFEIRDSMTFIPALAIRLLPGCEADRYLFARSGYSRTPVDQGEYVLLGRIAGGDDMKFNHDPAAWFHARTMHVAHQYILENWDHLQSGAVVDVQYILGEKPEPKKSESEECPL